MPQAHRTSPGRQWAIGIALYLGAVVLGLGSAWWAIKYAPWNHSVVQVGAWKTNLQAGNQNADIYTRASVALNALLALDRSETMYFIATEDDTGRPLRSRCNYRVEGAAPNARWWSITAYADDMFLFDIAAGHHSLNGSTARLDARNHFAMTVGSQEQPGTHWLAANGDRGVVLTLRLYNPLPGLQAAPGSLLAPTITALGVCP
jgi:hypothetical protein